MDTAQTITDIIAATKPALNDLNCINYYAVRGQCTHCARKSHS